MFKLLKKHPNISGLYNPYLKGEDQRDEGQHSQSVYPKGADMDNSFGFDTSAHLDESSKLATAEHAKRLFKDWKEYWDTEKPVLLENSPPNLVRTRYLQSLFPNTYFIIVMRHPIPASYETMKWSDYGLDAMLKRWLSCHEQFLRDSSLIQNVIVVKYEKMVSNPRKEIDRIFDFIGLKGDVEGANIKNEYNNKYFDLFKNSPMLRYNYFPLTWLFKIYTYIRFEERIRKFGYSLINM